MSFFSDFDDYSEFAPKGVTLPDFTIDLAEANRLGCPSNVSNYDFLRALCMEGVKRLGIDKKRDKQRYFDRVKYELEILKSLSLVDYILLIWDVVNFCKKQDIPTGVGRGSAAGCLVLYLCDVTRIDPIEWGLLFERFLSIERVNPKVINGVTYLEDCADVDLDISFLRRQEVIKYLEIKYPNKTCFIMTMSTLSGKLCVKEVFKIVAEMSNDEAQHVSDCIERVFGKVQALFCESDIESKLGAYQVSPEFKKYCDENPKCLEICRKLEGLNKNSGIHASGIVVSKYDLTNCIPTYITEDGNTVSCYDMNEISKMAVKADCLGLRTLDLIDGVLKETGAKISDIDIFNEKTYQVFADLQYPLGIFQIEAHTNFKVAKMVKPKNFLEVSDVVALARPGALDFVGDYCDVKSGAKFLDELDPKMDEIIRKTHGVVVYQEQLMKILHEAYGFSLKDANVLRGIVGKKKVDKMPEWKDKIYKKGKELGIPTKATDFYWKVLCDSANYSFNMCLSPDSVVETENGNKMMYEVEIGENVLAFNPDENTFVYKPVKNKIESQAELYEIEFENGFVLKCSLEHKLMAEDGQMRTVKYILEHKLGVVCKD